MSTTMEDDEEVGGRDFPLFRVVEYWVYYRID